MGVEYTKYIRPTDGPSPHGPLHLMPTGNCACAAEYNAYATERRAYAVECSACATECSACAAEHSACDTNYNACAP